LSGKRTSLAIKLNRKLLFSLDLRRLDAELNLDQEVIQMNRIATARAARDTAVKDAHTTKKMLEEAAIENVKEQITTHRASKTLVEASVSDTEASASGD